MVMLEDSLTIGMMEPLLTWMMMMIMMMYRRPYSHCWKVFLSPLLDGFLRINVDKKTEPVILKGGRRKLIYFKVKLIL